MYTSVTNIIVTYNNGWELSNEQLAYIDEHSEHIELATWNDGAVYSRDMQDAPHVVAGFTGI